MNSIVSFSQNKFVNLCTVTLDELFSSTSEVNLFTFKFRLFTSFKLTFFT